MIPAFRRERIEREQKRRGSVQALPVDVAPVVATGTQSAKRRRVASQQQLQRVFAAEHFLSAGAFDGILAGPAETQDSRASFVLVLPSDVLCYIFAFLPLFPSLGYLRRVGSVFRRVLSLAQYWGVREAGKVPTPVPGGATPERVHVWRYVEWRCALCFRACVLWEHVTLVRPFKCTMCADCLDTCFDALPVGDRRKGGGIITTRNRQRYVLVRWLGKGLDPLGLLKLL